MFNLRISGIIAGAAFILSFLLGLISRSNMPMLLIKPLLFAVLFFILSGLASVLVSRFLPELLEEGYSEDDSGLLPGSRIDITEGENFQGLAPEGEGIQTAPTQAAIGAKPDDSEEGIGDISDLMSKGRRSPASGEVIQQGMDLGAENGYTKMGELGGFTEPDKVYGQDIPSAPLLGKAPDGRASVPSEPRRTLEEAVSLFESDDFLPDLDSMAGAFTSAAPGENPNAAEYSGSAPPKKSSSGKKDQAWAGDFNAKEMAAGLRTVLNKDKEG